MLFFDQWKNNEKHQINQGINKKPIDKNDLPFLWFCA